MVEDKVCLLLKVKNIKKAYLIFKTHVISCFSAKNLNEYNDIPSIHSENLYAGEE